MNKFESKKYTITFMIFFMMIFDRILAFIVAMWTPVVTELTKGFLQFINQTDIILAGALAGYIAGQSYIDGRKEYKERPVVYEMNGGIKQETKKEGKGELPNTAKNG